MDQDDLRLLKQILLGDEEVLQGLLKEHGAKVVIKAREREKPDKDGRTVYLKLKRPFPSTFGNIMILRIKGVRPRHDDNPAIIKSHTGSGFVHQPVVVNENGNLGIKIISPDITPKGIEYDPALLGPQGALLKGLADTEYRMMRAGITGQGFKTDYPIAAGLWKNKRHADRLIGFVIAGMRSEDIRLKMGGIVDPNDLVMNIVTGDALSIDLEMSRRIYRAIGGSLRAYHDAGYFHRYPHCGNWGVEIGPDSKERVIMRDLDTTVTRNEMTGKNLRRMEAAYRLIDFQRIISDLSRIGRTTLDWSDIDEKQAIETLRPFIKSFLMGYFSEIPPDSEEFLRLATDLISDNFTYMTAYLKDTGEKIVLNKNTLIYGNIWKHLYGIAVSCQKNSAANDITAMQRTEITEASDSSPENAAFTASMRDLEETSRQEFGRRAVEAGAKVASCSKSGRSLILYADDILQSAMVVDLEYTIKNILAKHNVLNGGKIILYARKPANAAILENMVKHASADIKTVKITREELQVGEDEIREVDVIIRSARAKGVGELLGLIKGPTKRPEELVVFARDSNLPIVIVGLEKGIYSFAQAIAMAIDAGTSEGTSNGWLIMLPPIRALTDDIKRQYEDYQRSLQALVAA